MAGQDISTDVQNVNSAVMDHARDFVELVYRSAPAEYLALIRSVHFRNLLAQENSFNAGKLFVFAEFVVFRRAFRDRFPEASPAACINAFSGLFLKNDISITNLVNYLEGPDELAQLRLAEKDH